MRQTTIRLAAAWLLAIGSATTVGAATIEIPATELTLELDGHTNAIGDAAPVSLSQVMNDGSFLIGLAGSGGGMGSAAGTAMVPVPEPSTLVLVGLGTILFAGRLRRRRADAE